MLFVIIIKLCNEFAKWKIMNIIYERGRKCRKFNSRCTQGILSAMDSSAIAFEEYFELPHCNFI